MRLTHPNTYVGGQLYGMSTLSVLEYCDGGVDSGDIHPMHSTTVQEMRDEREAREGQSSSSSSLARAATPGGGGGATA
jgi:hypothetical protein